MTLPKISIWSLFRDDAGENLKRYQARISSLEYPKDLLRFYLAEGDSKDNTWEELQLWAIEDYRVTLIKCDTGSPRYKHTPHPERLKCLATVGNAALDALAEDRNFGAQYACLIESDLLYGTDVLATILSNKPANASAIAPMIWLQNDSEMQFYDIWAFRDLEGEMFKPFSPTWYGVNVPDKPFEVSSVGSMTLFDIQPILDGVRYTEEKAVVGICEQYRQTGCKIYCDPNIHILHPRISNPTPRIES